MTKNAWINKRILQKIAVIFVAGVVFATFFAQTPKLEAAGKSANNFDLDTSVTNSNGNGVPVYSDYLAGHSDAPCPNREVLISSANYSGGSETTELIADYAGAKERSVLTGEEGYAEWTFNVPETGMYNIALRYFPYEGKGGDINRSFMIDGKFPFEEAQYLTFHRVWKEVYGEKRTDSAGNDVRPAEEEVREWTESFLEDSTGYAGEPLEFYFTAGTHVIRLTSDREPMLIESLKLCRTSDTRTYSEVKTEYESKGYKPAGGKIEYLQAENMFEKSSRSIFPQNDRSSAATQPQDIFLVKLNSMGGSNWQNSGAWVSWKLKVEESGLYKIAPRFRQNFSSGKYVSRKLTVNGEVPFKEAESLKFDYSGDWQIKALGDEENGDYLFYFEAEKEYTVSLEVVLGSMGEMLTRVDRVVDGLNECYREILMITGTTPDSYREYNFEEVIPETLEKMKSQAKELEDISEKMVEATGARGESVTTLDQLVFLLKKMTDNPDTIGGLFTQFKDNISALGSWILSTSQQPLALDYFAIIPADEEIPKADGGFFENLAFGFKAFLASFVVDYSALGSEEDNLSSDSITVWLATGRDQYSVIRQLIDGTFTPQHGTKVNLQLVGEGTLLPSVLTGKGPDVSISNSVDSTSSIENPIDYAVRHAVEDLKQFEDYDEVVKRFHESAMVPYTFKGGVYALPETQNFNMLFVRTDIFEEMNLKIPKTWNELETIIPELQKKNMSVGIPHDLNALLMFMYQRNTPLYLNEGGRTNLDSKIAIQCFQKLTEYFTLYNLPTDYDFYNRFRSGEIPIGIQDYTVYNQLSLFAPEIRGDWIMTSVPGTVDENGNINNSITAKGTAVMMLKGVKNKESAWEFMKWWTSAETQSEFTNQMQNILSSGMQATANVEALSMLPWPVRDYKNIEAQWKNVVGTPEVPGGYYTSRVVNFAFNDVYNTKKDPGDTLQSYIESLNSELTRKRKEFGIEQGD